MKNKGFTLIELLAVIVILAIIALIAIPMISKIIDKTEDSAVLRSAELYIDGVNQAIMRANLTNKIRPKECIIQEDGNLICDGEYEIKIEATGTKPNAGTLIIEDRAVKSFTGMILDIYELATDTNGKVVITKVLDELDISSLIYEIDNTGVASHKTVTITYPIIDGQTFVYEYSLDKGMTWIEASQVQKVVFKKNGSIIARVTSGSNTVKAQEFMVDNIIEPQGSYLKASSSSDTTFLGGTILKTSVESITIINTKDVSANAIGSWDVTEAQDASVIAWYLDDDNDNLYELYIGGNGGVRANPNSSYLFANFTNAVVIDVNYLDTSEVTSMTRMFYHCDSLIALDLSTFDTSNVTLMDRLINYCGKLTKVDLSNFDTSKVTTMQYMFGGSSSLTSLDLSSFNTSNVTVMNNMFNGCSELDTIDFRIAEFTKVSEYTNIFTNCSLLKTVYVKDTAAQSWINTKKPGIAVIA